MHTNIHSMHFAWMIHQEAHMCVSSSVPRVCSESNIIFTNIIIIYIFIYIIIVWTTTRYLLSLTLIIDFILRDVSGLAYVQSEIDTRLCAAIYGMCGNCAIIFLLYLCSLILCIIIRYTRTLYICYDACAVLHDRILLYKLHTYGMQQGC